jgi:hypothetical protein
MSTKIELNLEPGTSLDTLTLAKIAAEVETRRRLPGRLLAMVAKGIPEHFGRMAELEAKIKGWAQLDYPCSNVFVTFETEAETTQSPFLSDAWFLSCQTSESIQIGREVPFPRTIGIAIEGT